MPSFLSRLSVKKAGPKVFVKQAMDNVKKGFRGNKKSKKQAQAEEAALAAYAAQEEVFEAPAIVEQEDESPADQMRRIQEESMDLTNSVMIKSKSNLSALREDSYQEKQAGNTSIVIVHEREDSVETFIEEEDSMMEEKARSPSSSPITMIMDNTLEEVAEDKQAAAETSVVSIKELVTAVPIAAFAPVIAVVEKETSIVVDVPVATAIAPVVATPAFNNLKKADVFEALKQSNSASRTQSSAVGNLRAKFEGGNSKPTPTSLKGLLTARNNKFNNAKQLKETFGTVESAVVVAAVPVTVEQVIVVVDEVKPIVIEEVKPVVIDEVKPVIEEVKPLVVEEVKPVVVDEVKPVVIDEVKPVVVAAAQEDTESKEEETKTAPVLTSQTLSIGSGEEKALHSAMLEIAAKPYKDQAVWFMNAYWNQTFKSDVAACERVWAFCHKFSELDSQGVSGCELDELRTHRVLEVLAEALTITEMRTKFHGRARHVSLIELLIFVFAADWIQVVTAPQGSAEAKEQMLQAEALMAKCSSALAESKAKAKVAAEDEKESQIKARLALESKQQAISCETQATQAEQVAIASEVECTTRTEAAASAFEASTKSAEAAKLAEDETIARAEQCSRAENEAKSGQEQATQAETKAVQDEKQAREAESEAFRQEQAARESERSAVEAERSLIEGQARVEAALLRVKEEETAFNNLLEKLKQTSENTSLGIVARRTASHEREVLLAKNPDPLTRARIAEEAVVRKHEKLIRMAAGARAAAAASRGDSEIARDRAVQSRASSENARAEAAIRRSASETKAAAAEEARKLSQVAKECASLALAEAQNLQTASDLALESARQAKESATVARQLASKGKEQAADSRASAERDEEKALDAQKLAEESHENAERAVVEAVTSVERARSFVERVRKQASSGQGGWWWASREIEESKRYVPQKMMKKLAELQM